MSLLKHVSGWFQVQSRLNTRKRRPLFQEREVWMCHWGANVGFELDGKTREGLRPGIVFKKLSGNTLLLIPLTSKLKDGTWYSPSYVKQREGRFCLNQIRMIDAKRLKYRMERMSEGKFQQLKYDFQQMLLADLDEKNTP
jgi:mRNA interferase MazF